MTKMLKSVLSLFLAVFMAASLIAVPSSAISLSKSSVTVTKGYQTTLSVSGTSKTVTWSTGDKSIATVSSKGKVVGKKPGTTYVYAKVGGNTLKCKVTVVAAKITASSSNVTFSKKGETKIITMTVKGSHSGLTVGTTNKKVVSAAWVKPVSWDGDKIKIKLTAQGTGSARIKVYLKSYSSTCYKYIDVKVGNTNTNDEIFDDNNNSTGGNTSSTNNISIIPYTNSIEVPAGGTYSLEVYSTNHTNTLFTVADKNIASVVAGRRSEDIKFFTITGIKAGTTTLRFYNKNKSSNYKDVKITVTASKYYEIYDTRPTVQSPDKVIEIRLSANSVYYMIVPKDYDPAYANSLIAKKFSRYSYYTIYNEYPSRTAVGDSVYEFYHSNSKYNYGLRYVLVPATTNNYDQVKLNTAVAQYNEKFEYWTVYSVSPTKNDTWGDTVEQWQITDSKTGAVSNRYLLVPYYGYDIDRINQIREADIAANSAYSYYVGYATLPTVNSTKDKIIMYRKNNANKYMVVPADDSGIAKANDAIAKDVGFYEYNIIYSVVPAVSGSETYMTVQDGGTFYYILLKDKEQTPDTNLAKRYANGRRDDD